MGKLGSIPIQFVTRRRARFAEVDPYGHVNTEHYLAYFIDHRFDGLRDRLGLDLKSISRLPVLFVTRKVSIEFVKSLRAEEEFEIRSSVTEFAIRSCKVSMTLSALSGETCARCEMDLVCVDRRAGTPVSWPDDLVARFYVDDSAK